MRVTNDRPRPSRRPSRARILLLVLAVIVILLILSLRGIAGFYTDYLWFGSVHLTSVWRGVVFTKIELAVVFTAVFFAAVWLNLAIADRLAPAYQPAGGPEDEFVQRYREAVGPRAGLVRVASSLVLALLVGTGAAGQWNKWLLFRHSVPFHQVDPQFHRDIGFFVFRLPFYSFLVSWGFVAVVVITIVTVAAHYLNGGIRLQLPSHRVTSHVKLHVSVLLGCLALLKAVGYYLQRFELDFSTRGVVNGATYTDVKAQLPALTLLILISLVAFVLFIYNTRQQGWVLPVIGVGLWAFVSVIVGAVYPWFIQKFKVQPSEAALEKPYIARNIQATRAAYGINHVKVTDYPYSSDLSATDLTRDPSTVRNIRLWEPPFATQAYQRLQEIKSYYQFPSVGIDRYKINGQETQTLLAVRQINPTDLPAQTWTTQHLQYTHGYGAVMAPANAADTNGEPVFDIRDIPPVSSSGAPTITQPRVYFGLGMNSYVVADSRQQELDYQTPAGVDVSSTYKGSGGVPLGGLVRRAAFALRFGDINLLISGQLTSSSRIMFYRGIQQRISKAAPFLALDSDPYPAIVGGHIVWIQDAYTTSNNYPYSQQADTSSLPQNSGLNIPFNYVRNSVKVVVDAYSGKMTFYVTDPSDPIIRSYEAAFPKLFTDARDMPADLRAHLRYPEDMFRVQTAMYGRYHITSPSDFYTAANAWNVSQSAGEGSPSAALGTQTTDANGNIVAGPQQRMNPQYLLMRVPGAQHASFLILDAFVPRSQADKQQNLSAFMVALSDPSNYGQLEAFQMPPSIQVDGPALIDAKIAANSTISQYISLVNQQGSQVQLGSVLVIPVQSSLIYVRPLYVESTRTNLPELQKVIVVSGGKAVFDNTLQGALTQLFGAAPATLEQKQPGGAPAPSGGGGVSAAAQGWLNQAAADYQKALADLKAGDLGAYQQDITNMGDAIAKAGGNPGATPPTTSPSTTSTTSPSAAGASSSGSGASSSATSGST